MNQQQQSMVLHQLLLLHHSSIIINTSVKGPSTRVGLDDLHQSPILHSTTTHSHTSNGDYRSTLYPNIVNNPTSTPIPSPPHGYGSSTNHSTISKLIQPHQESETNSY